MLISNLYYQYSALIIPNYIFHTIRIIPVYIADILNQYYSQYYSNNYDYFQIYRIISILIIPNYIIIERISESYIVFVILPINYFDILLLFRILSDVRILLIRLYSNNRYLYTYKFIDIELLYRISYRNVPNRLFEYNMSISIFPNRIFRNRLFG